MTDEDRSTRIMHTSVRRLRRGTGTLDLLVSFTLLMTVMTAATPLVVRYHRLVKSHRNYRLALDELSNQMDRLTALPLTDLPQVLQQIAPSEFIKERLAGAALDGDLQPTELGIRVTLRISWDEFDRVHAPLTLSGWVFSATAPTAIEPSAAVTP